MSLARVLVRQQCGLAARGVGQQSVKMMGVRALSVKTGGFNPLAADRTNAAQKVFHKSSIACLALTPVALALHPTPLAMPLDVVLSVLFPLHGHIGISWILTDYVKAATPGGPIRMGLLALTGLTTLGLLKLSVSGEGIVGTLKATWKGVDAEEKK